MQDSEQKLAEAQKNLRKSAVHLENSAEQQADNIGARALPEDMAAKRLAMATGSVLILFSGFCFLAAVWRQMITAPPPGPDAPRLPSWLPIAVNGFLLLVSLFYSGGSVGNMMFDLRTAA